MKQGARFGRGADEPGSMASQKSKEVRFAEEEGGTANATTEVNGQKGHFRSGHSLLLLIRKVTGERTSIP